MKKASSCPNLNRETTSFPNFFTLYLDSDHDDDTTLHKRRKVDHSEDTEASETSPFKEILSPFVSFNEMNEFYCPVGGSFYEWDEMDQTLPRWPPSPNGSDTNVSVGSNQFSGSGVARRLEVKIRSTTWWDQVNRPGFSDHEFRRAFKMSKSTFDFICNELDPILTKKDSNHSKLCLAIPVCQRVAICIWHLATGEPLRLVSKKFGLEIYICHILVLEVCSAIKTVLMNKFMNWPDEERMKGVKREFEFLSEIPNFGGSMYTRHLWLKKIYFPITVQGFVDSNGLFTDVRVECSGSMSDDMILERSVLRQRANCGVLKDVWIVGNSVYPLTDWLLVPYAQQNLWSEKLFNERVGEAQRVAKEAFSRLKGRWSFLKDMTVLSLRDLPVISCAACVLHNICEMRNEVMDPSKTSFDRFDDEMLPKNGARSIAAMRARDQIAHHLAMSMV